VQKYVVGVIIRAKIALKIGKKFKKIQKNSKKFRRKTDQNFLNC
jgi:hypothetical protein